MECLKNNKGMILLILGVLALIIYNMKDFTANEDMSPSEYSDILLTTTTLVETNQESYIMVDIKGEVNYPGLYQVKDDIRLGDLINIAGGATSFADLSNINLAMKLTDEMYITIPRIEEVNYIPTDIVKIKVEIKGEVNNPGVYILYPNSRVSNLIEAAGGLTDNADTTLILQAKILTDGETITIPKLSDTSVITEPEEEREIYVEISGEVINPGIYLIPENYTIQDLIYEAGGVTANCNLEMINWDISLCLGATIYIPSFTDEITNIDTESNKININTANLEELITLTGIGQILGQRIIDYRAEFGDFFCIEDIMNVSGIKSSIYEEIKESITV